MSETFPMPIVSSRSAQALTFPMPASVMKLAQLAREHSWEVITQYSQGRMPHTITGKPGALKDAIGVRFGQHPMTDRRAWAVYSRTASGGVWVWSSVCIYGPRLSPYMGCNVTELQAYLMMPDSSDEAILTYVEDLKYIKANAEELAKRRAQARSRVQKDFLAQVPTRLIVEAVAGTLTREEVLKIMDATKSKDREGFR